MVVTIGILLYLHLLFLAQKCVHTDQDGRLHCEYPDGVPITGQKKSQTLLVLEGSRREGATNLFLFTCEISLLDIPNNFQVHK